MGAQPSSPDNAASFCELPSEVSLHERLRCGHHNESHLRWRQSPATALTSSIAQAGEQSGVEEEGSEGSEGKEQQQGHGGGHSDWQDSCRNADWPSHQPEGSVSPCPSEFLPTASIPSHLGRLKNRPTFLACRPRAKVACQMESIEKPSGRI